jgi:predicted nucleic acid-binding protein
MSADWGYIESSAFVKLAVPEPESEALARYLRAWKQATSSAVLRVEVLRAVRPHGQLAEAAARERLRRVRLIAVDAPVLDAATLQPSPLHCLDAIHLATARQLGGDLGVISTYDRRLAAAASELGMPVASPA